MKIMLMHMPGSVLVPADTQSELVVSKWAFRQGIEATVKRVRNITQHRKAWVLATIVSDYSSVYDNPEKAMVAIKIAAGHVDWIAHPLTGEMIPMPKSISFASMDQDAFAVFWQNARNAVLRHLVKNMDQVSLDKAIDEVMPLMWGR